MKRTGLAMLVAVLMSSTSASCSDTNTDGVPDIGAMMTDFARRASTVVIADLVESDGRRVTIALQNTIVGNLPSSDDGRFTFDWSESTSAPGKTIWFFDRAGHPLAPEDEWETRWLPDLPWPVKDNLWVMYGAFPEATRAEARRAVDTADVVAEMTMVSEQSDIIDLQVNKMLKGASELHEGQRISLRFGDSDNHRYMARYESVPLIWALHSDQLGGWTPVDTWLMIPWDRCLDPPHLGVADAFPSYSSAICGAETTIASK